MLKRMYHPFQVIQECAIYGELKDEFGKYIESTYGENWGAELIEDMRWQMNKTQGKFLENALKDYTAHLLAEGQVPQAGQDFVINGKTYAEWCDDDGAYWLCIRDGKTHVFVEAYECLEFLWGDGSFFIDDDGNVRGRSALWDFLGANGISLGVLMNIIRVETEYRNDAKHILRPLKQRFLDWMVDPSNPCHVREGSDITVVGTDAEGGFEVLAKWMENDS